jgi:hypothetical protein
MPVKIPIERLINRPGQVVGDRPNPQIIAKGRENIFNKIIARSFPNPRKKMVLQVQEAFRMPNKQDQKRTSLCHIILRNNYTK